ncbi:hypothetical protein IQ06DRAFT_333335 [Phaeosphaeriaceae sp. SRC1lsM3a]|nr:hypothetical protein IQ06DRAFT_333335 [Stagonospora sp. SRC1lsM3a]
MSLLQLPPETLIQIFDYVGSSYFRSDLSRLTVCKQWSKFAYTACFCTFHVTQKQLRRLLSSPYVELSLPLVKDSMETLELDLKGFEDWDLLPVYDYVWQNGNVEPHSSWNGDHGSAVRAAWTTELNNDLLYLSTIMKQSRKLRTLSIQTTAELHPIVRSQLPRSYLFASTTSAFLSASNLTSLDLDLCGSLLISDQNQELDGEFHACTSIAALLSTLRRLRLRLRIICPDALKPRQHSTNLSLNEVLINLSKINKSPLDTAGGCAKCCDSYPATFDQMQADMERQAQVLMAQMENPKVVRILMHTMPRCEMRAFDALTGRYVKLAEGADWDDDGEAVEDEVSDEQSY